MALSYADVREGWRFAGWRMPKETAAATTHRAAAPNQAMVYSPVESRMMPAAAAAMAAPIWWEAKTQPKTMIPLAPNACRHKAAVGGTVATQSSP